MSGQGEKTNMTRSLKVNIVIYNSNILRSLSRKDAQLKKSQNIFIYVTGLDLTFLFQSIITLISHPNSQYLNSWQLISQLLQAHWISDTLTSFNWLIFTSPPNSLEKHHFRRFHHQDSWWISFLPERLWKWENSVGLHHKAAGNITDGLFIMKCLNHWMVCLMIKIVFYLLILMEMNCLHFRLVLVWWI